LINVIFEDMMEAYEPERLRLVMVCNARGGISSKLTIDSDWEARGGKESYKDWLGQSEEW
jgi:7-cyano-7-deazaguanine reductase